MNNSSSEEEYFGRSNIFGLKRLRTMTLVYNDNENRVFDRWTYISMRKSSWST